MSNVVKLERSRPEARSEEVSSAPSHSAQSNSAESAQAADSQTLPTNHIVVVDSDAVVEEHIRVEPLPQSTPLSDFLRFFSLTIASSLSLLWFLTKGMCWYGVKHPLHVLLNISMVVLLALVVVTGSEIHSQMILGKISDQTIDKVIEGSRFTREYDSDEVNRGSTREFLRVGAPVWAQRESVRAILFHSRKAGLSIDDQAVLLAIADIESGFNPMARASTTTACGLFQFVKATGETFALPQSDCMDPWRNAEAGVAHYLYNYERRVGPQLQGADGTERLFRLFELSYYLHHDGPQSNNPNNEVKATILNGSQFLFKAHRSLKDESESQQRAPTFTEKFSENFWKSLDTIKVFFANFSIARLWRFGASEFDSAISAAVAHADSFPETAVARQPIL